MAYDPTGLDGRPALISPDQVHELYGAINDAAHLGTQAEGNDDIWVGTFKVPTDELEMPYGVVLNDTRGGDSIASFDVICRANTATRYGHCTLATTIRPTDFPKAAIQRGLILHADSDDARGMADSFYVVSDNKRVLDGVRPARDNLVPGKVLWQQGIMLAWKNRRAIREAQKACKVDGIHEARITDIDVLQLEDTKYLLGKLTTQMLTNTK